MTETQTIFEYLKQGGLLGLACLLGWMVKWLIQKVFAMYDARVVSLEQDLEKVKVQRDAAREQLLTEKDRNAERYHRIATQVAEVNQETGRWLEYVARAEGGGRRGGGRPPPPASRNRPHAATDEGGEGT